MERPPGGQLQHRTHLPTCPTPPRWWGRRLTSHCRAVRLVWSQWPSAGIRRNTEPCPGPLPHRCNTTNQNILAFSFREINVLFNDALNTFYLRLYGARHMVKDHSDSEKGNPLSPHRQQQGFFYMHHPTDRITHTTAFVTPVVEHWLVFL